MIEIIKKDITTVTSGIVAHGVNCQHKMGSGVALAIRKKWPPIGTRYLAAPDGKQMLGIAHIINVSGLTPGVFVANCYTQEFYGRDGKKYASDFAIVKSLITVYKFAKKYDLDVYLPKIGSGLGGLDWESEVLPIITDIDTAYNKNNTTYICEWK